MGGRLNLDRGTLNLVNLSIAYTSKQLSSPKVCSLCNYWETDAAEAEDFFFEEETDLISRVVSKF